MGKRVISTRYPRILTASEREERPLDYRPVAVAMMVSAPTNKLRRKEPTAKRSIGTDKRQSLAQPCGP